MSATRPMAVDDDDRPDVAIEVIWTSGGLDKLEVYRKLGVSEVWFYERGTLRFFTLRDTSGDERYTEIERSELLPELPVDSLLACMREPDQRRRCARCEPRSTSRARLYFPETPPGAAIGVSHAASIRRSSTSARRS